MKIAWNPNNVIIDIGIIANSWAQVWAHKNMWTIEYRWKICCCMRALLVVYVIASNHYILFSPTLNLIHQWIKRTLWEWDTVKLKRNTCTHEHRVYRTSTLYKLSGVCVCVCFALCSNVCVYSQIWICMWICIGDIEKETKKKKQQKVSCQPHFNPSPVSYNTVSNDEQIKGIANGFVTVLQCETHTLTIT